MRRAFTLIELLVVVGLTGVLIALILPAVQGARGAARRLQCASNMKQLGLAAASYESTHRLLPLGGLASGSFSHLARLLPFLDQSNIFNQINFALPDFLGSDWANETISTVGMGVFMCPSDGQSPSPYAWTNYAGNLGHTPFLARGNGSFAFEVGAAPIPLGLGDFPDGTGTTAAMAEWLVGFQLPGDRSIRRTTVQLVRSEGDFGEYCRSVNINASPTPSFNNLKGNHWLFGSNNTLCNHVVVPNGRSCMLAGGRRSSPSPRRAIIRVGSTYCSSMAR